MNNKDEKKTYVCPVCKLKYEEEEWVKKCEAWCTEHQSCNLDIIKHAAQS
jgi:hypothetical protein